MERWAELQPLFSPLYSYCWAPVGVGVLLFNLLDLCPFGGGGGLRLVIGLPASERRGLGGAPLGPPRGRSGARAECLSSRSTTQRVK